MADDTSSATNGNESNDTDSSVDGTNDVGSEATGYGGFGGLGIGNPGSYGGQQSVGAPGFEGDYGKGDDSYDKAYDGFKTGNYAYAFENLVEGIFSSAVEYGVSVFGGKVGMTLGGALFGGYGAIIGYVAGKYVGSELGEELAQYMLDAEENNYSNEEINNNIERIASENGLTANELIIKITEGLNEDGIESLLTDISSNYQDSVYYDIGLSRRRSNIIGTGRKGLTIE